MQTTHKQPWECPAITPAALPMHQSRSQTGEKKTLAKGKPLHLWNRLILCQSQCSAGDVLPLSMFQYLKLCRCLLSGPSFGMSTHHFYKGCVEIWQWKLSVQLCSHLLWILNTGICEKSLLTELNIYIKANSVMIFSVINAYHYI